MCKIVKTKNKGFKGIKIQYFYMVADILKLTTGFG